MITSSCLSEQVYLISDSVVKLFVEGGLEASIHSLGAEVSSFSSFSLSLSLSLSICLTDCRIACLQLEFYSLLCKVNSPLKDHIPDVLASGILFLDNGSYTIVPWDGKGVPDVIAKCNLVPAKCMEDGFSFGVWSKKDFEYKKAGASTYESISSAECAGIWPYIITKRCKGKIFARL